MSNIIQLITENFDFLTFIIAAIGLFLSIGQLIHTCVSKRTRLSASIENYEFFSDPYRTRHTFFFLISNLSSSPIAITRILIEDEARVFPCCLTHQWHGEHYYPNFPETDIPLTERIFTVDFPIQLAANQSFMGYVIFPFPADSKDSFEGKTIKFRFITDKRTKSFRIKCPNINNQTLFI